MLLVDRQRLKVCNPACLPSLKDAGALFSVAVFRINRMAIKERVDLGRGPAYDAGH